jgi:hypothetical protein
MISSEIIDGSTNIFTMFRFNSNCLISLHSHSNSLLSSLKFDFIFRSYVSFLQVPTRKLDLGSLSDNRKATKEVNDNFFQLEKNFKFKLFSNYYIFL